MVRKRKQVVVAATYSFRIQGTTGSPGGIYSLSPHAEKGELRLKRKDGYGLKR